MGCICPKRAKKSNNYKQAPEGSEETAASSEQKVILTKKPLQQEVAIQKRILSIDEVDWHAELPNLIQQSGINTQFEQISQLIASHRSGEGMKLLLNKEKTDFSLGVFAKITKDENQKKLQTYYSTWTVDTTPEEIFYFNLLQDKSTRLEIDSSCEQFDLLAAVEIDGTLYILTYLKTAKFMIIKGKETFYIKAFRKVRDDDTTTVWVEANTSVTHESVPELSNYKRVNIFASGLVYTYDKQSKTTFIEGYSHILPQVSAGMLILKPVVGKYYKTYLRKTVEGIKKEREEKKYNYEELMSELLQGGKMLFKDYA